MFDKLTCAVILRSKGAKWVLRAATKMKRKSIINPSSSCAMHWSALLFDTNFFEVHFFPYVRLVFIYNNDLLCFFWGVTTGLELAVDPQLPLTGRTRNQIWVVAANPHPAGKEVRIVSLTRWVGN